jgi:hypothetical protein
MINIIVGAISVIAFGALLFWGLKSSAREWFEFPKYKMLEDDKRFSELEEDLGPRTADSPRQ